MKQLAFLLLTATTLLVVGFSTLSVAYAQPAGDNALPTLKDSQKAVEDIADKAGYEPNETPGVEVIIGQIVRAILTFLGVIFFVIMVYGGWTWFTAGGNEEQVTKAKGLIINSMIGLVIIFTAYAISFYVVDAVVSLVTDSAAGPQ